jgi:hypothetical protein
MSFGSTPDTTTWLQGPTTTPSQYSITTTNTSTSIVKTVLGKTYIAYADKQYTTNSGTSFYISGVNANPTTSGINAIIGFTPTPTTSGNWSTINSSIPYGIAWDGAMYRIYTPNTNSPANYSRHGTVGNSAAAYAGQTVEAMYDPLTNQIVFWVTEPNPNNGDVITRVKMDTTIQLTSSQTLYPAIGINTVGNTLNSLKSGVYNALNEIPTAYSWVKAGADQANINISSDQSTISKTTNNAPWDSAVYTGSTAYTDNVFSEYKVTSTTGHWICGLTTTVPGSFVGGSGIDKCSFGFIPASSGSASINYREGNATGAFTPALTYAANYKFKVLYTRGEVLYYVDKNTGSYQMIRRVKRPVSALPLYGILILKEVSSFTNIKYGQLSTFSAPNAPTIGTATVSGISGTASIAFSAPANTGGSPITGYTVTSIPGGITATGATSPITITGLTNNTSYTFTVKATTAYGTSSASNPSNSVTPYTVPNAPTIGSATAGRTSASVAFTAPAFNGGSVITSYTVTSSPGGIAATGSSSPITVLGLTSGIVYTFTVKATNAAGSGTASVPSNSVTPYTIPNAPTNVAVAAGDTQAIVSFTVPENNGGVAITQYNVYNASSNVLLSYGVSSPITIVGLTNGVSYQVYVKAVNLAGESIVSDTSLAFMPFSAEGPPCFFGEAPVLTPSGYKRMDSIKVGDVVLSDNGEEVQVKHVEICLCAASKQNNPFIIEKGEYGATERVLISPDHRVSVGGKMVKAKQLDLEREEMNGVLHYYNLQLENWSNMVVAGVKVESLAPIQHTTVTVEELVSILQAKYGSDMTTKEITNKVLRTCRLMADGRVEVPILRF